MKKIYKIGAIVVLGIMFVLPLETLGYACPQSEFKVIPEGLIQPGQEFTVQAMTEHFSVEEADVTNMFYVWCLDDNLVNTINAGSDDKFVKNVENDGYHLENEYGKIKSDDIAACKGFRHKDSSEAPGCYFVERMDGSIAGGYCEDNNIDLPPEEWILKREPVVDTDNDGLDDNWEIKYFSGRKIEDSFEIPVETDDFEVFLNVLNKVVSEGEDSWTCGDVDAELTKEEEEQIAKIEISEYMPTATDDASKADLLSRVTPEGVQVYYESVEDLLPEPEKTYAELTEEEKDELTEQEKLDMMQRDANREIFIENLSTILPNPITIPDPDGDAWQWPYNDGATGGDEGAPLFARFLGMGWFGRPWMIGLPYPQNAADDKVVPLGLENPPYYYTLEYLSSLGSSGPTGFGAMIKIAEQLEKGNSENNLTEYFRGTDPLDPDTDDDGVPDSEDYLGRMQDNINLRTQKTSGEKYKVAMTAFGVTEDFRNGEVEQYHKYDIARFPLLYDKCDCDPEIITTPEGDDEVAVGTGLALKIGWGYSPAPPVAREGEKVVVNVKTSRLTDLANLDLKYNWYLDSEGDTPWNEDGLEENKSGHNKESFQFEPNKAACEEHIVGLEITEEKSNSVTFQEMPIPMGFDSNLITNVIGNVDLDSELAKKLNETTGADLADYDFSNISSEDFILANDYFRNSINEMNEGGFGMGFRKGDLIEVKINNIEEGYGDACEEKYGNYEVAKENFFFNWWYTRRKQNIFSGKGFDTEEFANDHSKAYFIVRDDARGTDNDGQDADSLVNTGSEFVSVEMLDGEGNVLAKNKENIRVIYPYVDFVVEGAEVGTSREDTDVPTYYAERGDEIKITSILNYFRPSNGYDQTWKRNGEVRSELRGTPDMINSTYTFRAGMDINGNELDNKKETITLEVDSHVSSEEENAIETADETIVINLEKPLEGGVDTAVSGAINKFIPSHYRGVFGLFMTFGLAGAVLVFVLGFMKKTSGKK